MGKTKLRIVIVALLVAVALITVGCEKATESKAERFTITYSATDATAGTAPTDDTKYAVGEEVTAKAGTGLTGPSGTPTFTGWNTKADGTGKEVSASGTYTVVASDADSANVITLYARWGS